VKIPQITLPAPYSRVDIVGGVGTPANFTRVSTNLQEFPVLRDDTRNVYTSYDDLIADVQGLGGFGGALEKRIGNQIARRIMKMLGYVCRGAVQVVNPSRVADYSGYRADWPMISEARGLIGDNSDDINVMVCHSQVYNSLLADFAHGKYNTLGAASIMNGKFDKPFMGLNAIIETDQMPVDLAGSVLSGGTTEPTDTYWSFLFRGKGSVDGVGEDGSIFYGYQDLMNVVSYYFPLTEVPGYYLRAPINYVLSPYGFAFNGPDNPSDSELSDQTNWSVATDDLRRIGIIAMRTSGLTGLIRPNV
jgi:hypothetical protein